MSLIKEHVIIPKDGTHRLFEALMADIGVDKPTGKGSPFQVFRMWKPINGKYVKHIKINGMWVVENPDDKN